LIAYGSIAYIFYRCEDKFTGTNITKGLCYGISIGILWLWGMLEGVLLYGNPVINEFITGSCDCIPVVLMGLLLGIFTTENNDITATKKSVNSVNLLVERAKEVSIINWGTYDDVFAKLCVFVIHCYKFIFEM